MVLSALWARAQGADSPLRISFPTQARLVARHVAQTKMEHAYSNFVIRINPLSMPAVNRTSMSCDSADPISLCRNVRRSRRIPSLQCQRLTPTALSSSPETYTLSQRMLCTKRFAAGTSPRTPTGGASPSRPPRLGRSTHREAMTRKTSALADTEQREAAAVRRPRGGPVSVSERRGP